MKNLNIKRFTKAGCFLIGLCLFAPSAFADDKYTKVVVRMDEFKFTPQHIVLKKGKAYELVLINDGVVPHEWDAPDLLAAVKSEKVELKKDGQMVGEVYGTPDEIEIGVGAKAEWFFTTVRKTKGRVKLLCDIPGHLAAGMHGTVQVK